MADPGEMPPRWIALLRAINVGGHTVKMDRLRALFAELGLANVATFIASGNVIFDAPGAPEGALAARIEEHLGRSLGYAVATFLRSPAELGAVARHEPFPPGGDGAAGQALYVAFLAAAPPAEAQERLLAYRSEVDDFHVHGREVYWRVSRKISQSTFSGALLERAVGAPATVRNITTVRRLAALYPPA